MSLTKMDHVAIEVADIDRYIDLLVGTGGMKLLRRATALRTGTRMAMVGDPNGMKLELIENAEAAVPRYLHVAFRSENAEDTAKDLIDKGWSLSRGPVELKDAQARSMLLSDPSGFELQVLTYQPTSPDIVEWSQDEPG